MNRCKECPRKIPKDSKYCRFHSAKSASKRVKIAEKVGKVAMSVGPIVIMILTRGRVKPK